MIYLKILCLIKLILILYFNYSSELDCNINCSPDTTVNNTFYFNQVIKCFANNTYDTTSLPTLQSREIRPFTVTYSISLIDVLELNSDGNIVLLIQLYFKWTDYNRCWDKANLPIESVSVPLIKDQTDSIWFPQFELLNARSSDSAFIVPNERTQTRIYNDGTIKMLLNLRIEALCNITLYLFPFDTQRCSLHFQLSQYIDQSSIKLKFDQNSNFYPKINYLNSEWFWPSKITTTVRNYSLFINEVSLNETFIGITSDWAQGFEAVITIQRDPTYYQLFILIPMFLVDIIMLFVVFNPLDNDKRVDVCIACLLGYIYSLIVIASLIPRTHTIPIIVLQIVALLLLSTYNTIMVVIILALKTRGNTAKKHENVLSELLEICKAMKELKKENQTPSDNIIAERYKEEINSLDRIREPKSPDCCRNFLEALCFCFTRKKPKKKTNSTKDPPQPLSENDNNTRKQKFNEDDNELYDAFKKVKNDSVNKWLKMFGVMEIGYWVVLKILCINLCCIPCFWYPKWARCSKTKSNENETNDNKNDDPQPCIKDCLCCCCDPLKTQTQDSQTQKMNPTFAEECEDALTQCHHKIWNNIAKRLNIFWELTSLLLLITIIAVSFILWFTNVFQTGT